MKWCLFVVTILLLALLSTFAHAKPSRTLTVGDTEVAQIKTALGFSTILQFDSHPVSAVVGDQDAFRVEYVGNSVTIKPILRGSKSNLFVFTDYDRFNFQLVTTNSMDVDYIVIVRHKQTHGEYQNNPDTTAPGQKVVIRRVRKISTIHGVSLELTSVAWPETKASLIVAFSLNLNPEIVPDEIRFSGDAVNITQGGIVVPIDSLYLEELFLSPKKPLVRGTIILRASDFKNTKPLTLGFSLDLKRGLRKLRIPISVSPYFRVEISDKNKTG